VTWISQIFDLLSRPFIWWVVVAPWEAGIRSRLGKNATILNPGIHLRLPFIDRVYLQSTRLRMISDSGQTMTTKDGKVVTVAVACQYAIADIKKLYMEIAHPESTLLFHVQGLITQIVSQSDSKALSPKSLQEEIGKDIPAEQWGLEQVKVWVINFALVKTYRLLMNDYRNFNPSNDLDQQLHVK